MSGEETSRVDEYSGGGRKTITARHIDVMAHLVLVDIVVVDVDVDVVDVAMRRLIRGGHHHAGGSITVAVVGYHADCRGNDEPKHSSFRASLSCEKNNGLV
jgi:phage baseplate assembly protein gpV